MNQKKYRKISTLRRRTILYVMISPDLQDGHEHPASRPEPIYVPYTDLFPGDSAMDFNFGDPADVLGLEPDQWFIDTRLYYIQPESVIGNVMTLTGERMQLTAPVERHVIRMRLKQDDLDTQGIGTYLFIITSEAPALSWDQAPIEYIEPDWPDGIEFADGSFPNAIQLRGARKLAVNIDEIIESRRGHPRHRVSKRDQGGWQSRHERDRRF